MYAAKSERTQIQDLKKKKSKGWREQARQTREIVANLAAVTREPRPPPPSRAAMDVLKHALRPDRIGEIFTASAPETEGYSAWIESHFHVHQPKPATGGPRRARPFLSFPWLVGGGFYWPIEEY